MDNVMIERLGRSVKHEEVYLKAYDTVKQAKHNVVPLIRPLNSVDLFHKSFFAQLPIVNSSN